MSSFTVQLPTGTNVTQVITLPRCGGWMGSVTAALSTGVDATIKSLSFYYDELNGVKWGRRTGGLQAGNWQNWTLIANSRPSWPLLSGEGMVRINYDATSVLSLSVETTRGAAPLTHPRTTGIPYGQPGYGTVFSA